MKIKEKVLKEKEIEKIRNTLEDVDFQKSLLSQLPELNKYIEILSLEREIKVMKETLIEVGKVIDDIDYAKKDKYTLIEELKQKLGIKVLK